MIRLVLVVMLLSGCSTMTTQEKHYIVSNVADGLSTEFALSQGHVEANPFGYPYVLYVKGVTYIVAENFVDEEMRTSIYETAYPMYYAVTANNVAVGLGMTSAVAWGVAGFIYLVLQNFFDFSGAIGIEKELVCNSLDCQ